MTTYYTFHLTKRLTNLPAHELLLVQLNPAGTFAPMSFQEKGFNSYLLKLWIRLETSRTLLEMLRCTQSYTIKFGKRNRNRALRVACLVCLFFPMLPT